MKLADCIIAVSSNTKKNVISMLNTRNDKVTTIPNGVDAQFRVKRIAIAFGNENTNIQFLQRKSVCLTSAQLISVKIF